MSEESTTDGRVKLPVFKQLIMAPWKFGGNGGPMGNSQTIIALAALADDGSVWRWDPADQAWKPWPLTLKWE